MNTNYLQLILFSLSDTLQWIKLEPGRKFVSFLISVLFSSACLDEYFAEQMLVTRAQTPTLDCWIRVINLS